MTSERPIFGGAGELAASRFGPGDGNDTPTGSNLPGQPSPALPGVVVPVCLACGFIGPLVPRLPCYRCHDNPWARGEERTLLRCTWQSTAVWWKPLTWGSGRWVPVDQGEVITFLGDRLADAAEKYEAARARYDEAQDRLRLQIVE